MNLFYISHGSSAAFLTLFKLIENLDDFSGLEDNVLIKNLLLDCNSGLSHVEEWGGESLW